MPGIFSWGRITLFIGLSVIGTAGANTLNVGPQSNLPPNVTADAASLNDVPWNRLLPGDQIIVYGGIYPGLVIISAHGSQAQPIIVKAAPGTTPIIENSVLLEGASDVEIDGLKVEKSSLSGFILRHGATRDTIRNSTVSNSQLGIWIGDGAGGENKLINNTLNDNKTHGIAVDMVNAEPGKETVISGNTVFHNGMHGLEITGNYYIIEYNKVFENGLKITGTSAIHLFSGNPNRHTGSHNIIRYNTAYGEKDNSAQDGNGIQLDQWCDENLVYFNVSFGNDGAGISVFDSANNQIFNNTLFDNARDPGKSHAYPAELVIASDYTKPINHAIGNIIRNNVIVATRPSSYAVYVDRLSAANTLELGNNILFQTGQRGDLFFWSGKHGTDIAEWNTLKQGAPDKNIDPSFVDIAQPDKNGLRPSRRVMLGEDGASIPLTVKQDLAGLELRALPIGAYVPAD